MNVGQHNEGFVPAVLACEPTGGVGEEEEAGEEDDGRDQLDSPWDSEGGSALVRVLGTTINEGGTVLNEVLDQDTPGDSPLLRS